ncbi:ThiF family adenylyltransferase [Streptomyces sp. JJ36]|uniref:HesA/MoeB/ThiF family protein n=1 Tax=Streptomyces sp. JJ36 TaxID=2736645 RepID=UPI001EFFB546|nr:ThiF family adenylyltransferase [Streptomyces sp. JJ36]
MLARPRVKPEHRPYRTADGNVRIGSVVYGIGAEVSDPEGWIWTLTQALDGTRSVREAVAAVALRHPERAEAELREAMQTLLEAGFLEDAAAAAGPGFSPRERERYGRGVTLLRWMDLTPRAGAWELQERLRAARVLLIGLGGTGGAAAQALVASGVGRLHCVDPDEVELSNLNRQLLFREADIGLPKVAVALASLRALNSEVTVTGHRGAVGSAADLAGLLAGADPADDGAGPGDAGDGAGPGGAGDGAEAANGAGAGQGAGAAVPPGTGSGYDLLVLAADQPPEIRRWANRACLAAGVSWVDAGYRGPLVTVGLHVPGRGACWECHHAAEADRRDLRLGPGQDESAASPRMPWNPVNAVTAGLSGSLLAHAALTLLTGAPPVEPGFRTGVNLMAPEDQVTERFGRRADCPACGAGVAGGFDPAGPGKPVS